VAVLVAVNWQHSLPLIASCTLGEVPESNGLSARFSLQERATQKDRLNGDNNCTSLERP